jgi:hypothetical protein
VGGLDGVIFDDQDTRCAHDFYSVTFVFESLMIMTTSIPLLCYIELDCI